jgi:electron transfer flavoprotein beta subunit
MTPKGILEHDTKPSVVFDYNALKDDPLIEPDTIGLKGSPTNIFKSFTPPLKGTGVMLDGSGKETVDKLFAALAEKHVL